MKKETVNGTVDLKKYIEHNTERQRWKPGEMVGATRAHCRNQVIKVTSPVRRHTDILHLLMDTLKRAQGHLCDILAKNV